MNITLISALPGSPEITGYIKDLISQFSDNGHSPVHYDLDKMDINSCTGCWSCWVKTPGKCILKDDMESLLRSVINADLVIFLAETVLGYVNHRLKMAMDRCIPLVHPYIEIVQGECHHRKRYEKYPLFGLILENEEDLEEEDSELIEHLFRRFALNFKSRLAIFSDTSGPVEEVLNEIDNL